MVTNDPISDMLTRIRNAIAVNKSEVKMPHSKAKEAVARILKESGFLNGVSVEKITGGKELVIEINDANSNAVITEIKRLSKPGRRVYAKAQEIPTVKNGRGVVVISTSRGMMAGTEASKQQIGGELICQVY